MPYLDYEADCRIINKLMIIDAGISQDPEIVKQAGIADDLGGVAQSLYQAVSGRIGTYGVIPTIATYLAPAVLYKIWWPLGILPIVANALGFDLTGLFQSVINSVQQIITGTGDFTQEDARRVADESTSSLIKGASLDILRDLEKQGELVNSMIKTSGPRYSHNSTLAELFSSLGNSSLGNSSRKVLFGGFIRWIIMAVLTGVALFEGPKVLFGTSSAKPEESQTPSFPGVPQVVSDRFAPSQQAPQATPQYDLPEPKQNSFNASGKGNQYHANSPSTIWLMDNVGSVENTLIKWAFAIYPELNGHAQEILNSPSFNKIVSVIYEINPKGIGKLFRMPPGTHSIKDVIDRFAGDIRITK